MKQGSLLSPLQLLFSFTCKGVVIIAERVQGAVTGSKDVRVMHMYNMLNADDLTLLANTPGALQTMLDRLAVYVRSKHLTINTEKSEVVH